MGDHDFDARLNSLADRASQTLVPRPVTDIRRRGDARRRRHQVATASLGVLAVGILALVAVPAMRGDRALPATPSPASSAASLSAVKVTGDAVSGVVIAATSDRGKALAQR